MTKFGNGNESIKASNIEKWDWNASYGLHIVKSLCWTWSGGKVVEAFLRLLEEGVVGCDKSSLELGINNCYCFYLLHGGGGERWWWTR
jgi:hypothetical protein